MNSNTKKEIQHMARNSTMQTTSSLQNGQECSVEQHKSEITSSIEEKDDPMERFITAEDFSQAVQYHVKQYGTSYTDAIMEISQRLELDPAYDSEYIKELVDRPLKEKLYAECVNQRVIRDVQKSFLDV